MLKRVLKFSGICIMWFFILSIVSTILFRFIPIPFTPLMLVRLIEQKEDGKDFRMTKDWQSLENISPDLPLAVVTSEDQKFEDHFGFDISAIEKATKYNEKHKGKKMKALPQFLSRLQKMFFYGHQEAGSEKALKFILHS